MTSTAQSQREEGDDGVEQFVSQLTRMIQHKATQYGGNQHNANAQAILPPSQSSRGYTLVPPFRPFYALHPQQAIVSSPMRVWSANDLIHNSHHLDNLPRHGRVRLPTSESDPSGINATPAGIIQRLSDWMSSNWAIDSNILWIDSPFINRAIHEELLSSLAASVITLADQSNIPVMSYFCDIRPEWVLRDHTRQAFLAMCFSLLRQMIGLLKPLVVVDSDIDLRLERFAKLDGALDGWKEFVALFSDIVPLCPKVIVVVDGLQGMDIFGEGLQGNIRDFVALLRDSRFKVLFTTSGTCLGLRGAITPRETLHVKGVYSVDDLRTVVGPAINLF